MARAYFGRPERSLVPGGAHFAVYLVPVFDGRLLVFDVAAEELHGRWLPWDVLPWGGNPYVSACELAEDWCGVPLLDLRLVDVLSFELPGEGWELAVVFRAELGALPTGGGSGRSPHLFERGHFDAIARFEPVDLERWVLAAGPRPPAVSQLPGLVF